MAKSVKNKLYEGGKAKMELTLTTFLIVCPLIFLGSFIDAIGGGGALITLPAYLMAGVPVHMAIGTNKIHR